MKRLCLVASVLIAVFATGCKKTNEETLQDGISQTMQAKTGTPDVQVINGRLVFSNIDACEKFGQTYANTSDSSLDSLETSMGYTSYRRSLGSNFYDETLTIIESSILATILNPDRVYQVGDSAFWVHKVDSTVKVHMLSGVTEAGINKLKSGVKAQNISDVTEIDLYGELAKSTSENCGACRTTQEKIHVKKADFTYNWQGQTRYCKGKNKMENIGALKTLFVRMHHYRGANILVPLPGSCRFRISGCASFQYKIGSNCYFGKFKAENQPFLWSAYSISSHQVTYALNSKCFRNWFTATDYYFEYETSTSATAQPHYYPGNLPWERGYTSCF